MPFTVAIVVDRAFRESLRVLGRDMPVWIVDTPENRPHVEAHWAEFGWASSHQGVTAFTVDESATPNDWAIEIVVDVEVHHGEYSHVPPVSQLLIYGTRISPRLSTTLAEQGFTEVVESAEYLVARNLKRI